MNRFRFLFLALLTLLPCFSCDRQQEEQLYTPVPDRMSGMWVPYPEEDGLCDRYVQFSEGQCLTYLSYSQQYYSKNEKILYEISAPFSLENVRTAHLSQEGHLIVGKNDLGKVAFIKEAYGTQEQTLDVLVIGNDRYLPVSAVRQGEPLQYSRIELLRDGEPVSHLELTLDETARLSARLYVLDEGHERLLAEESARELLYWYVMDDEIASVNGNNVVLPKKRGKTRIKVITDDMSCAAACELRVGGGNLSRSGTANCYIVPALGHYRFRPSRGNSDEILSGIVRAEVLWATFGTETRPEDGIIRNLEYRDDGHIHFDVPDDFPDANLLVAGRDASDDIVWSWHLWLCRDFDPLLSAHEYYNLAGRVMDRNLGALSAVPGRADAMGLLYQWGRKDPFLNSAKYDKHDGYWLFTYAKYYHSNADFEGHSGPVAVSESIRKPTHFIMGRNGWMQENTEKLWAEKKTVYDPCPPGWQVALSGDDGTFVRALGGKDAYPDPPRTTADDDKGFQMGTILGRANGIWFPTSGMVKSGGGCWMDPAHTYLWLAMSQGYDSTQHCICAPRVTMIFKEGEDRFLPDDQDYPEPEDGPDNFHCKSFAYPVRCIAERE